jgi:hypothetical protein
MISIAARLGLPIEDLLKYPTGFSFDQHSQPAAKSLTAVIYTVLNAIFCGGGYSEYETHGHHGSLRHPVSCQRLPSISPPPQSRYPKRETTVLEA